MSQTEIDAQEDTPFLAVNERRDESPTTPKPSEHHWHASAWQIASPKKIVVVLATVKFCIYFCSMMMTVPIYRLIEDALCHAYFNDDSAELIDEMECKVDQVQQQLAILLGWLGLLGALVNLIIAYPYGSLADTIGRKPTLLLSYGGLTISFLITPFLLGITRYAVRRNPYILMFGAFLQLIGGGASVVIGTLYSIASDVSTEQNKASHFIYLTMGATLGATLGPLISGILMSKFGPWVPIFVMASAVPLMFPIIALIPETLVAKVETQQQAATQHPFYAFRSRISVGLTDLRRSMRIMRDVNIMLILLCFFFQNARFTAYTVMLAQYISKHFRWTLAETSILLSPLNMANLIILTSMPKVSKWLMARYQLGTFEKDIWLTRASYLVLVFAAWMAGLSRRIEPFLFALFINTLGAAEAPLARASVSHFVEPGYTSRLFALLGMAEVLGSFAGPPMLAWCFSKGLELKGFWTGLPWYYVGFLSSITLMALMLVKPPKKTWRNSMGEDDDDTGEVPSR